MTKAEIRELIVETVQATVEALLPAKKPKEPAAPIRHAPEHDPQGDVPGVIWIRPMSRPSPPRQLTETERVQRSFERQRAAGGLLAQWRWRP